VRLLLLAALSACDGTDTGTIGGQVPESSPMQGPDPAELLASGEVAAGVVRTGTAGEAALFGGLTAQGAAGDVKIYNDRVQFIIQRPIRSHGMVDIGGHVLDADLVRPAGQLGRDTLEDQFLSVSMSRVMHADTVEIISDGTDGEPAVVVAAGRDVAWPFMMGVTERDESVIPPMGLKVENTYTLEPDAYSLRIDTTLTNGGEEELVFGLQDGIMVSAEDLVPWAPGAGYEGPQSGDMPAVLFVGRQGEATLSMWQLEGAYGSSPIAAVASALGIALAEREIVTLAPGDEVSYSRALTVAPDTLTAEGERWAAQGTNTGEVNGQVVGLDGVGVPGVRVHFVQDEAVAGFAVTDDVGRYTGTLPIGNWTAWAVARGPDELVDLPKGAGRFGPFAAETVNQAALDAADGTTVGVPLAFATGRATQAGQTFSLASGQAATIDLNVPSASGIEVHLWDADGAPLPGVLDLQHAGGAPDSLVPEALREALGIPTGSRAAWAWTADGTLTIPAVPGDYTLSAGHSWRHDRVENEAITVIEGEFIRIDLTLPEQVVRDGWLALDSHLHGAPSFDGALPMEDRLIVCAATGVEMPVTTDHDRQAEYRDLATALGLDPRMHVTPGVEVTTIMRGHFNLFPIEPRPADQINGGALSWWEQTDTTEGLFERMRAAAGPDALLQVNHPRTPGMFDFASYDAEEGIPLRETHWSWDFEIFELWNGGVDDREELRTDWFSFLDQGVTAVPVGVSDSHYRFIPCGMGRSDVFVDETDPANVTTATMLDGVLAGHVVASVGLTLRASAATATETALPGDTLTGDSVQVSAQVRAPEWVVPDTLRVYRNGEVVAEETMPEAPVDGLWWDGTWTIDTPTDAWIVVEVEGATPMGATWRNVQPYAIANAIRVDTDGDGWTPPNPPDPPE
jgi:hypothetical protein